MKNKVLFVVLLLISFLLFSCSDNQVEDQKVEYGYEYFPLKLGNEWIYEVDSLVYNSGNVVISSKSQLREKVVDTLRVGDRTEYIIRQSSRKDDTQPWNTFGVITTSIEGAKALRTENNLKFIKLVFPVRSDKTWDGNVYFDSNKTTANVYGEPLQIYRNWEYEMILNDSTAQINGITYDSILTVNQVDFKARFTLSKSVESYAKNVGMISKSHTFYKNKKTPVDKEVEFGFEIKYNLLSFK